MRKLLERGWLSLEMALGSVSDETHGATARSLPREAISDRSP